MQPRQSKAWHLGDRLDGLLAIERELRGLLDQRLKPSGLTYSKFALLRFIKRPTNTRHEPMPTPVRPLDVAAHFKFSPRTVTEAIDGLVDAGLVERVRNPNDRRSWVLCPIEPGASRAIATGKIVVRRTEGEIFSALPATQDDMLWFAIPNIRRLIAAARRKDEQRRRQA
jgi:DNA-binding MarR family transcriptional regulator